MYHETHVYMLPFRSFLASESVVKDTFSAKWSARVHVVHIQKYMVTPAVKVRHMYICTLAVGSITALKLKKCDQCGAS